jgi:hypothetical protein
MKYLKLFESFDDINQDIEGLLIELKDKGLIEYSINDGKDPNGLRFKTITFSRIDEPSFEHDWLFKTGDLLFEVKTLEDYLLAHKYEFHYNYEYYDNNDIDGSTFNNCRRIDDIKDLTDIAFIHLGITSK